MLCWGSDFLPRDENHNYANTLLSSEWQLIRFFGPNMNDLICCFISSAEPPGPAEVGTETRISSLPLHLHKSCLIAVAKLISFCLVRFQSWNNFVQSCLRMSSPVFHCFKGVMLMNWSIFSVIQPKNTSYVQLTSSVYISIEETLNLFAELI